MGTSLNPHDDTEPIPVVTAPRARHAAPAEAGWWDRSVGAARSLVSPARSRHASRRASTSSRAWRVAAEIALVLVVALVGSLIVRAAIAQPSYVPTSDMENTLQPGDRVLVLKGLASIMGPSRGEVVMLRDPGGWTETGSASPGFGESVLAFLGLAPSVSRDDLVMRVIGLGGDTVACCTKEGKISVNGVALNEPYLPSGMATDQVTFDVTVPDGSLFVMGDNRAASRDSRYHLDVNSGGVPTGSLLGRVGVVLWPLGHAALVRIPHAFARIPDPGTP